MISGSFFNSLPLFFAQTASYTFCVLLCLSLSCFCVYVKNPGRLGVDISHTCWWGINHPSPVRVNDDAFPENQLRQGRRGGRTQSGKEWDRQSHQMMEESWSRKDEGQWKAGNQMRDMKERMTGVGGAACRVSAALFYNRWPHTYTYMSIYQSKNPLVEQLCSHRASHCPSKFYIAVQNWLFR